MPNSLKISNNLKTLIHFGFRLLSSFLYKFQTEGESFWISNIIIQQRRWSGLIILCRYWIVFSTTVKQL